MRARLRVARVTFAAFVGFGAAVCTPLLAPNLYAQGEQDAQAVQDAQDARTVLAQREDFSRFVMHTWSRYIRYLPNYVQSDPLAAVAYGMQREPELMAEVYGYALAEQRRYAGADGWERQQLQHLEDQVKRMFAAMAASETTDRDEARRAASALVDAFNYAGTDAGRIELERKTGVASGSAPSMFADQADTEGFAVHVADTYMANVQGYNRGQTIFGICAWCLKNPGDYAMVIGYALGRELDGLLRNSPEHRRWLRIEHTFLAGMDKYAEGLGDTPEERERIKAEMRSRFFAAAQGFVDPLVLQLIGMGPDEGKKYLTPEAGTGAGGAGSGTGAGTGDTGAGAGTGASGGGAGSTPAPTVPDSIASRPQLSVMLVVDVSGSMSGNKLAEAKEAAKKTLSQFLLHAAQPGPGIMAAEAPLSEIAIPGAADFTAYAMNLYLPHATPEFANAISNNPELVAQILGYALGQQLQHIQNDPGRHRTWLRWENALHARIDTLANRAAGDPSGQSGAAAAERERLWNSVLLAEQGWLDPVMSNLTGVAPGSAPSAFGSEPTGAQSSHEFGILAYSGSCDQNFWYHPFSRVYQTLAEGVDALRAGGGTPMTPALNQARYVILTKGKGRSGSIILLSDGQNSCGDSPVEAADRIFRRVFDAPTAQAGLFPAPLLALGTLFLQQAPKYPGYQQVDMSAGIPPERMNTPISVSTVGFQVNDRQQAALDSIAAAGGGVSARAENMAQLAGAFQSAVQAATAAPPPAPTPSGGGGAPGGMVVGSRGPGGGALLVLALSVVVALLLLALVAVQRGWVLVGAGGGGVTALRAGPVSGRPAGVKIELELEITDESGAARRVTLRSAPATIGREADNDLVLTDPEVSRHHARVVVAEGRLVIEDLGSTSGMVVNEQSVPRSHLDVGSVLQLGRTTLRVI